MYVTIWIGCQRIKLNHLIRYTVEFNFRPVEYEKGKILLIINFRREEVMADVWRCDKFYMFLFWNFFFEIILAFFFSRLRFCLRNEKNWNQIRIDKFQCHLLNISEASFLVDKFSAAIDKFYTSLKITEASLRDIIRKLER